MPRWISREKSKLKNFFRAIFVRPKNQDFNGASARRFRPSSSTRESLAMAVAERKAAMVKHKDGAKLLSGPGIFWKKGMIIMIHKDEGVTTTS